jgi:hypothetical protein
MRILTAFLFIFLLNSCVNKDSSSVIHYPEGGYSYNPAPGADSDFLYYPLKHLFSRRDSFNISCLFPFTLASFDELNISLRPLKESVFRFSYFDGALSEMRPVIILLKENEIVVKEGIKGWPYYRNDTKKLTQLEEDDYELLSSNYPLNSPSDTPQRKRYMDSLTKKRPELLDARYYKYLSDKSHVVPEPFEYKVHKIDISWKIYSRLVNQINESEYWKLPFDYVGCSGDVADGAGFVLEANTPMRYNVVRITVCFEHKSSFIKACEELVKAAGLQNKIRL